MKPTLRQQPVQAMAMTPQLLQSIRLLQLSSLELEQELREALERNVLLETVDDSESGEDETEATSGADQICAHGMLAGASVTADLDGSGRDSWWGGESRDEDDAPWEARIAEPAVQDARLAAIEQLKLIVTTPREARLVTVILEAIDDNGYLEQPLDGIARESGLDPLPGLAEVEAALQKVQSVEPTGFGARDLRECLLLQIHALPPATRGRALAERIVSTCLDRLANREFDGICTALGVDRMDLHDAVELILSLNPKPGAAMAVAAEAALPDVVVSGVPGAWKIELNAERLPRVRINRLYERLLAGASERTLRDQLQEARWLVRGVEMRNETLLRTARAIFERQQGFLERGEEGMAPLTLREIADAIGMHESTVCRVTTNKWAQTPWGIYELKAFFPSQIMGADSETSGTAVKAMIRRIVDAENASHPLCDGEIAAILARHGVHVARRTVAKYREAMGIPPAKERCARVARRRLRLVG
ncbi:RNA polymerase, sigma 54 subunit, RpoN/SigL [Fontimonas thermophila]|uniref:RNA polymerase sigma-54 factor n=1 Tax=Fontimonas thermophila TaxID=1076937 RepID=A0A1I2HV88_9GAMM|nr:RNA polymerase factor sigma-54 [Fontimonas thermophila]SFF33528.1 RNA polymerase, sigma 54 subunit, RpoN/SigL [Fontimonas thermophila]